MGVAGQDAERTARSRLAKVLQATLQAFVAWETRGATPSSSVSGDHLRSVVGTNEQASETSPVRRIGRDAER